MGIYGRFWLSMQTDAAYVSFGTLFSAVCFWPVDELLACHAGPCQAINSDRTTSRSRSRQTGAGALSRARGYALSILPAVLPACCAFLFFFLYFLFLFSYIIIYYNILYYYLTL